MEDRIDMYGVLTLQITDRQGQVVQIQRCKNRIVTAGRYLAAELFTGVPRANRLDPISHMGVGTANRPPADADTALDEQRGERKPILRPEYKIFTESSGAPVTRVQISLEAVFEYTEANDPSRPLYEAGIFNSASAGTMYSRVVFAQPVTKTDTFKLTLLWDVIF